MMMSFRRSSRTAAAAACFLVLSSTTACSILLLDDDFTSAPSATPPVTPVTSEAGSTDGASGGLDGSSGNIPDTSPSTLDDGAAAPDGSLFGCNGAEADPNLIAHYAFDDGSGTTLKDCSGHGHDGIIEGGASSWATGRHGKALVFNGTTTCVDLGKQIVLTAFTATGWVNVTNYLVGGIAGYVLGKTTSPNAIGWRFGTISAPNRFEGKMGVSGSPPLILPSPTGQPVSTWIHLALVLIPGQRADIYINGSRAVEGGGPPPILEDANANLRIGCNNGAKDYFQGMIDELRLYSRALSDAEIMALAQ